MMRMIFSDICNQEVKISPFADHHLTEKYVAWLNDPDVVRYSEQRHKTHTLKSSVDYHNATINTNNYVLAIEKRGENPLHIGNLRVLINTEYNWASLSIMIGDKSCWGTGIGGRAWTLMLDTLLNTFNFRMGVAGTMEVNEPMINLMKSSGMKIDCVLPGRFIFEEREVGLLWASKQKDKKLEK